MTAAKTIRAQTEEQTRRHAAVPIMRPLGLADRFSTSVHRSNSNFSGLCGTGYRNINDTLWHRCDERAVALTISDGGRNRSPAATTLSANLRPVEVFSVVFVDGLLGCKSLSSGSNPFDFSKYTVGTEPSFAFVDARPPGCSHAGRCFLWFW
jgi:hypothetical protein